MQLPFVKLHVLMYTGIHLSGALCASSPYTVSVPPVSAKSISLHIKLRAPLRRKQHAYTPAMNTRRRCCLALEVTAALFHPPAYLLGTTA